MKAELATSRLAPADMPLQPDLELLVVTFEDSCAAVWPMLALEAGLPLRVVSSLAELTAFPDAVRILSIAGVEEDAAAIVNERLPEPTAVVGTVASHRVGMAVGRAGAAEYFVIPAEVGLLAEWVRAQVAAVRARRELRMFADRQRAKYRFEGILGESPALRRAIAHAARVIPISSVNVLLLGETGTGKELFARAIHFNGPRGKGPFVDVNCAAIPEHLLESELFGHEKGSFTGAISAKPGLFEVASGGTLFLDEIGHLPLALQSKLLRALEERTVRRVGATTSISVDIRVIAATHVDLVAAVRLGRFREDLYYRLNVLPIHLPPLRERGEDVLLLARHFCRRFAEEYQRPAQRLSIAAERILLGAEWPGNLRELRNRIERAVILSDEELIDATDLALDETGSTARDVVTLPFPATLADVTTAASHGMLALCAGNKSEAARRLGISRSRFFRLIHNGNITLVTSLGE